MNPILIRTFSQQCSQLHFFSFNRVPETMLGISGQGSSSPHTSSQHFTDSYNVIQIQCKKTSQELKKERKGRKVGNKHVYKLEPINIGSEGHSEAAVL